MKIVMVCWILVSMAEIYIRTEIKYLNQEIIICVLQKSVFYIPAIISKKIKIERTAN